MPMTEAQVRELIGRFIADRPDLKDEVRVIGGLQTISNKALPQYALWLVENGHAPPDAFGKALDLQAAAAEMFKAGPGPGPRVMAVDLELAASNDDLKGLMRMMRDARAARSCDHLVCTVRGFADDPRELWEIPAVRMFCTRLVNTGFISYLDVSTQVPPGQPVALRAAFGAFEVLAIAEGEFRNPMVLTAGKVAQYTARIRRANAVADREV